MEKDKVQSRTAQFQCRQCDGLFYTRTEFEAHSHATRPSVPQHGQAQLAQQIITMVRFAQGELADKYCAELKDNDHESEAIKLYKLRLNEILQTCALAASRSEAATAQEKGEQE